jgi:hypothetical protein
MARSEIGRNWHTRFMFGKSENSDDGTQAEIARLSGLPLEQLASQIKAAMSVLIDNGDRGRVSVHDLALTMVPGVVRLPQDEIWSLDELVGEGIQMLEHDGLAQCTVVGTDRRLQWVLTRRGRSTAEVAPPIHR